MGDTDGLLEGAGETVGCDETVGDMVGPFEGSSESDGSGVVGESDGKNDTVGLGDVDGSFVGTAVGSTVGTAIGSSVSVGIAVGVCAAANCSNDKTRKHATITCVCRRRDFE